MLAEKKNATNMVGAAGYVGSGNGNGGSATRRPPMGGDGAAGWDEGTSPLVVPQSVVPFVPAPTVTNAAPQGFEAQPEHGSVEEPEEADSFKGGLADTGDNSPMMRPPTPPVNHWSVRQPA